MSGPPGGAEGATGKYEIVLRGGGLRPMDVAVVARAIVGTIIGFILLYTAVVQNLPCSGWAGVYCNLTR